MGVLVTGILLSEGGVQGELRKFTISNIDCRQVTCVAIEGWQEGLTTLEISGKGFQRWTGQALVFTVFRHVAKERGQPVLERKVGVFSDGHLTASIPVFRLPDDVYDFTFHTVADSSHFMAMGTFTKITGQSQASERTDQSRTQDREPSSSNPGGPVGDLAGIWHGISTTVGELRIKPDGAYVLNGTSSGHVKRNGNSMVFDGPLTAWDNGRATLNRGVIEFYWTTSSGAKNWFTFAKE